MADPNERTGSLAGDLGAVMASGHAADVTILADGVWIPAHKAVLAARSRVFAAKFGQGLLKVTGGTMNIKDMNHEVLGQLLQFMYTDEAPLLEVLAAELLAAADQYCVSNLKQDCEQQLIRSLSVENAADSAVLAFVHSCPRLKAAAIRFIDENYRDVMATAGWSNALREHTEVGVEICSLLKSSTGLESERRDGAAAGREATGTLAGDLLALLESGEHSDVKLVTGGVTLAAHRAVLAARSGVLSQRLDQAADGVLQVADADEEDVRNVLRYVYSDQLPPPASVNARLLGLAEDFALRRLKDYCEEQLADQICVQNAVSVAVVATKHGFVALRRACVDFIGEHIFEVMETEDWDKAIHSDPEIVVNVTKSVAAVQRAKYESEDETSEE